MDVWDVENRYFKLLQWVCDFKVFLDVIQFCLCNRCLVYVVYDVYNDKYWYNLLYSLMVLVSYLNIGFFVIVY